MLVEMSSEMIAVMFTGMITAAPQSIFGHLEKKELYQTQILRSFF